MSSAPAPDAPAAAPWQPPEPPRLGFGRAFVWSLVGAALGLAGLAAAAAPFGLLVFLDYPIATGWFALAGLIGTLLMALRGRSAQGGFGVMLAAAVLTALLAAALPAYFLLRGSERGGGLLF